MYLRGMTQREITDMLPQGTPPIMNLKTGEPYDISQINRDLAYLKKRWRTEADQDTATARTMNLAENREARRMAWTEKKLYYVFEGLRQEVDLLGLALSGAGEEGARELGAFLQGVEDATTGALDDLSEPSTNGHHADDDSSDLIPE